MATKKQVLLPLAVVVVAALAFYGLNLLKKPVEQKEIVAFSPLVNTVNLDIIDLPLTVHSQGLVEPKEQTLLVAQVNGQIINISKRFVKGEFVKKGTVLLNIDPSDYKASLMEAQANLAAAKAAWQLEKARGHVALSEWQEINNAKPSQLGLRKPQLAQEVARMSAAQAVVTKAKRNLERTTIIAPYDAIINSRNVSLGSVVGSGSKIGLLSATHVALIRLPVADKELAFVKDGGVNAVVTLSAQFNGKPMVWRGLVLRNEGMIDTKSRMHYLVAEVSNPYHQEKPLRFGTYVTAQIAGFTLSNVSVVPRHLVVNKKLALMSVDSTLDFKSVTILRQQGDEIVISGDFGHDSHYITSALSFPVQGMNLSTRESKSLAANNQTKKDAL